MKFEQCVTVKNQVEALLFCAILDGEKIPYRLVENGVPCYGNFSGWNGIWGWIESYKEYVNNIIALYEEFSTAQICCDDVCKGEGQ